MRKSTKFRSIGVLAVAATAATVGVIIATPEDKTEAHLLSQLQQLDLDGVGFRPQKDDQVDAHHHATVTQDQVVFPDGDALPIRWLRKTVAIAQRPPFTDHYESLRASALEGDPLSAFALFQVLEVCKDALESQNDLDAALDQLQQTHSLKLPTWDEPKRVVDLESLKVFDSLLQERYSDCQGITGEQKAEAGEWLKMSATQGYTTAMIIRASQAGTGEERRKMYRIAWESGDVDGLFRLSHELQKTYNSGAEPRNKLNAYGALYAYVQIMETAYADHGPIARRQLGRIKDELAGATQQMQQHELKEAIGMAKDLVRRNPNCCYGM